MRHLFFSWFARGWPGIGLLLMRLVGGVVLVAHPDQSPIRHGLAMISGILLLVGLWTPIAGSLALLAEIWAVVRGTPDPWTTILLAAVGATLALVGPGFVSLDARFFGWRRIDLTQRRR